MRRQAGNQALHLASTKGVQAVHLQLKMNVGVPKVRFLSRFTEGGQVEISEAGSQTNKKPRKRQTLKLKEYNFLRLKMPQM